MIVSVKVVKILQIFTFDKNQTTKQTIEGISIVTEKSQESSII